MQCTKMAFYSPLSYDLSYNNLANTVHRKHRHFSPSFTITSYICTSVSNIHYLDSTICLQNTRTKKYRYLTLLKT